MNNLFDYKKNFKEAIYAQKKFLEGFETMFSVQGAKPGFSEKELVYSEDKMRVFRYKPLVRSENKIPTLIVYALINRETMMDLQEGISFIRNMLEEGNDIYIIDWGYPTQEDRYLTMEDYIQGYIGNAIDYIRKATKVDKVNLLGVCQGGTFSIIYASLNPEKINALVTMVAPVDFSTDDGLLFRWAKYLDIDKMVDAYGVIPGDFMNNGFLTLKPISLTVGKYLNLIDDLDNVEFMENFLRMESWIFDSPGQAGETIRQFIKDLYQENKLIQGELMIGDQKVNMKNITMPVLNIYGEKDHIVPPAASKNLKDYIGTKEIETHSIPTGHIGMYVSSKGRKEVGPLISKWLKERSK